MLVVCGCPTSRFWATSQLAFPVEHALQFLVYVMADRLNGRVVVEFADGTALIGHARDNSLVGPKLHYSMEPVKLLNITSQEGRVHVEHSL